MDDSSTLSSIEIEVLQTLKSMDCTNKKKYAKIEKIIEKSKLNESQVRKAVEWLKSKNLITEEIEERESCREIKKECEDYLTSGLPERKFLETIEKLGNRPSLKEVKKKANLNDKELSYSLGFSKKQGFIGISEGKLILTDLARAWIDKDYPADSVLKQINEEIKKKGKCYLTALDKSVLMELCKRDIIEKILEKTRKYSLLDEGEKVLSPLSKEKLTDKINLEIIRKGITPKMRPYNLDVPVPEIQAGKKHFLHQVREKIREIFLSMGFKEMKSDYVESCYWNFDVMFFPQDHPDREIMDTFYLKSPKIGKIPEDKAKIIKEVQENGWKTGSIGRRTKWDEEIAKKLILRCHTTQTSFRILSEGLTPPYKFFSIDRVFRNEAVDATHLAEFHQVEGFVVGEGLNFRNLLGNLKEFYNLMGIKQLKFKPNYNPYTEPSVEIFAYHPGLNRWVELGNSGIFRPETLLPYGIKVPVIAWGLALERLAMMLYEISDIRQCLGHTVDLNNLKKAKVLTKVI